MTFHSNHLPCNVNLSVRVVFIHFIILTDLHQSSSIVFCILVCEKDAVGFASGLALCVMNSALATKAWNSLALYFSSVGLSCTSNDFCDAGAFAPFPVFPNFQIFLNFPFCPNFQFFPVFHFVLIFIFFSILFQFSFFFFFFFALGCLILL